MNKFDTNWQTRRAMGTRPVRDVAKALGTGESNRNSRRHGRMHCELLKCYVKDIRLGNVQDLSLSGLRLRRRFMPLGARPDQKVEIMLVANRHYCLTLPARVVWLRNKGIFGQEIGLEFFRLAEEQIQSLKQLMTLTAKSLPM